MGANYSLYEDPSEKEYRERLEKNNSQKALLVIATIFTALDETAFTPGRDMQVLGASDFSHFFGSEHIQGNIFGLVTGAIASLPYLLKLFNKNQKNNLQDLLDNLECEIGHKVNLKYAEEREKLAECFNGYLKKKHLDHFIEAKIVADDKGIFDLKFYYKPNSILQKLYVNNWNTYKNQTFTQLSCEILPEFFSDDKGDFIGKANAKLSNPLFGLTIEGSTNPYTFFAEAIQGLVKQIHQGKKFDDKSLIDEKFIKENFCERLLAYAKIYPAFIDEHGKFSENTFEQCRIKALEHLNQYSLAANVYEALNNYAYAFWIVYFGPDMFQNQADNTLWSVETQRSVLGTAFAILAVQISLKAYSYTKNKFRASDLNQSSDFKAINRLIIDDTLKHQLLENYLIEQVSAKRLAQAKNSKSKQIKSPLIYNNIVISELLEADDPDKVQILSSDTWEELDKSSRKRILKKNTIYKTAQQFDLLDKEATIQHTSKTSFKRLFNGLNTIMGVGIQLSFIGWVAGAVVSAIPAILGLTFIGAFLLSNPVGLAFFGLGMLAGGIYYGKKLLKKEQQAEAALQASLAEQSAQIHKLKRLEAQNNKLASLAIANGKEPLTIFKSHNDRAARRLTTTKDKLGTKIKKGLNRTAVALGRAGTGILIVRLLIFPILAITASTVLGGPIGLGIALGAGLVWAGMNLYKYHRQSKLDAAKRTLEDIDTRTELEEKNQEILLAQLNYTKKVNKNKSDTKESPATSNSLLLRPSITSSYNALLSTPSSSKVVFFHDNGNKICAQDKVISHSLKELQSEVGKLKAEKNKENEEIQKINRIKENIVYLITEIEKRLLNNNINVPTTRMSEQLKILEEAKKEIDYRCEPEKLKTNVSSP